MLYLILNVLRDLLRPNRDLLLENLALRQQILILRRDHPNPPFSVWDGHSGFCYIDIGSNGVAPWP